MQQPIWVVVGVALLAVAAETASQQPDASARPVLVGTIHELMEDIIEPSAETLWDATAVLTDETGVHTNEPTTDADWERLRRAALALSEAPNLVVTEGRGIVPKGETMEAGGTLDEDGIRRRIAERRTSFLQHGAGLQSVARRALAAVDARDLKALDAAGAEIDAACEACHEEFWYPPEQPARR